MSLFSIRIFSISVQFYFFYSYTVFCSYCTNVYLLQVSVEEDTFDQSVLDVLPFVIPGAWRCDALTAEKRTSPHHGPSVTGPGEGHLLVPGIVELPST